MGISLKFAAAHATLDDRPELGPQTWQVLSALLHSSCVVWRQRFCSLTESGECFSFPFSSFHIGQIVLKLFDSGDSSVSHEAHLGMFETRPKAVNWACTFKTVSVLFFASPSRSSTAPSRNFTTSSKPSASPYCSVSASLIANGDSTNSSGMHSSGVSRG